MLSLCSDGSTPTPGSLIKGWEEQDGKQELLAAVFTDAFMRLAEWSPVNMDDGSFVLPSGSGPLFQFITAAVFIGNIRGDFY